MISSTMRQQQQQNHLFLRVGGDNIVSLCHDCFKFLLVVTMTSCFFWIALNSSIQQQQKQSISSFTSFSVVVVEAFGSHSSTTTTTVFAHNRQMSCCCCRRRRHPNSDNNMDNSLLLPVHGRCSNPLVVCFYGRGDNNMMGSSSSNNKRQRELQIRQKISQLKKEGRLNKKNKKPSQYEEYEEDDDDEEEGKANNINTSTTRSSNTQNDDDVLYADRIRQKLGNKKSRMLGYSGDDDKNNNGEDDNEQETEGGNSLFTGQRSGQIGSLSMMESQVTTDKYQRPIISATNNNKQDNKPLIDPSLFDTNDDDDEDELSEEDLVDMVAKKMMEKRYQQDQKEKKLGRDQEPSTTTTTTTQQQQASQTSSSSSSPPQTTTTSGVGGSWNKNETTQVEMYQPKTGSWGAFPRPRDISKAYGGGRRVGPGYSNEEARRNSEETTRERLKQYREKAGIDVQSEKDYAMEIEEALKIGSIAMQRGMYSTAVSALEKVTKYCSTNSKVGGKVFLELAMAYEAVGRIDEAITVYSTLSKCRIEEIKYNAKKLLYGIEAMQFMRNEMKDSNYSRKKVRNTFIDTTGLKHIAQNFDNVYQTAYIDLEGNFYKRMTESIVRSSREARQIILKATTTNAGEVERIRIVQALRSLSRHYDNALEKEMEQKTIQNMEPIALMNGKPILSLEKQKQQQKENLESSSSSTSTTTMLSDNFVLADSEQMLENLNGQWQLQLLADKKGDGVKFFHNNNTILSWQKLNMMQQQQQQNQQVEAKFDAQTPIGFGGGSSSSSSIQISGWIEYQRELRIIQHWNVTTTTGGGLWATTALLLPILMDPSTGPMGAIQCPQQIIMVDSTLFITRRVSSSSSSTTTGTRNKNDKDKDYFAVWRRKNDK